jgi:hypothetical protein
VPNKRSGASIFAATPHHLAAQSRRNMLIAFFSLFGLPRVKKMELGD